MYGQKKKISTFSYKLVQISPIVILVNSGAFLSISSWFCELTELIFVMIPYISSTGYPPKTQGIMGHVQVANANDYIPHEAHTTSAYSERTRGDLGEAFRSKMWFRNTGCFRKCFRKIVRHSGLFVYGCVPLV